MAQSSLLDANGTKVDNHDSGVGSSSERSEDTTPSEAGDGEFHADGSEGGGKQVGAVKGVVNCRKDGPPSQSSTDPHITVGCVTMSQQVAELYQKDPKTQLAEASVLLGKLLSI
jgi:hypothetical protein